MSSWVAFGLDLGIAAGLDAGRQPACTPDAVCTSTVSAERRHTEKARAIGPQPTCAMRSVGPV